MCSLAASARAFPVSSMSSLCFADLSALFSMSLIATFNDLTELPVDGVAEDCDVVSYPRMRSCGFCYAVLSL